MAFSDEILMGIGQVMLAMEIASVIFTLLETCCVRTALTDFL
jgi:hypothetical protein